MTTVASEKKPKGLMVSIYRNGSYDCTAGGVTANGNGRKHCVLVGKGIPEIFEATDDMPALEIEFDLNPQGVAGGYLMVARREWLRELGIRSAERHVVVRIKAKPLNCGDQWVMYGGNFVACSDARFPVEGAIPVFDRIER